MEEEIWKPIIGYENCCKYDEFETKHFKEHIEEEFADVALLLDQIREYYNLSIKRMFDIKEYKVARTLDRIETKYYEK